MNLRTLFVSMVLLGLFAFAFLNFGIQFAGENNLNQSIADSPILVGLNNTIERNISAGVSSSQDISDIQDTESPNPEATSDAAALLGPIAIVKKVKAITWDFPKMILYAIANVMGLGDTSATVVVNGLIIILIVVIVLLGWKVFKAGE